MAAGALTGAHARGTTWDIQGITYHVDTTYHAVIGPGMTRTSVTLSQGKRPLAIYYTTADISNPYCDVRVVMGQGKTKGCEVLSRQMTRNETPQAQYIAGTNADFFSDTAPIGTCISDSRIYKTANNSWVSWYIDADKNPGFYKGFNGTAVFPGGATHALNGINDGRGENQLIIYDINLNGANSGTNSYGIDIPVRVVEGSVGFAGSAVLEVTGEAETAGSMAIPAGGYVLSGHGDAKTLIQALKVGDRVSITANPSLNGADITQMVSGTPLIVSGGKTLDTSGTMDMATQLHPRTAVGYSQDGKSVVLLIVDGRQAGYSEGVTFMELADIMRHVGCYEAANLDGGGSSELYTKAHGVANKPSDGSERAVTNSIWNVSTAPADNEVASIAFEKQSVTLPHFGFYTPVIYAYNKYGVLIDTKVADYTLSGDSDMGEIVADGKQLFANGSGTHALTATYPGGITATCAVTIGEGNPRARLDAVCVDSYRDYTAEVVTMLDGIEMPIDNSALSWSTDDTSVATVDNAGVIHGVSNGRTTVNGKLSDFTISIPVHVEIPEKRHLGIGDRSDMSGWGTGTSLKITEIKNVDGNPEAFDVVYNITSARGTKGQINPGTTMLALPDSIRLVINPGDIPLTKLDVRIAPNGAKAVSNTYTVDFKANTDNQILVPVSDFFDVDDFINYPAVFTGFSFYPANQATKSTTLRVKAMQAVYTALRPEASVSDIIADDSGSDGPARYYNLQGQPANPQSAGPGLYLRRHGNKTEKVIIR